MLEVKIVEVSVTQMGFAIVLKPLVKNKVVPIFIGPLETYSISTALEKQISERPLTHDLMKTTLTTLGYKLEKVLINNFKNGTFYAQIFLQQILGSSKEHLIEIDSRPSDAIGLAIRFDAPIFMNHTVYEKVAIDHKILHDEKIELENSGSSGFEEEIAEELAYETEKDDIVQSILDEFENITQKYEGPGENKKKITPEQGPEKMKREAQMESYSSKKEVLEQMLQTAVQKENYEEAARIRDEIEALEKRAGTYFSSRSHPSDRGEDRGGKQE